MDEPQMRRPGEQRFPILAFTAETREIIGNAKRPEIIRWRAKLFGKLADEGAAQITKGSWVMIHGRLSGYQRPTEKEARLPEINAKAFHVFPVPRVSFTVEIQDSGKTDEPVKE
jgi:single-stranded DNA-binding protein